MEDSGMANVQRQLAMEELDAGVGHVRRSPADAGPLRMIIQRPSVDQRRVVSEGALDVDAGLIGDSWQSRGSTRTPDGGPNPDAQVTIINARLIALLAQTEDRWPLAGDQLVIDIDMSEDNLPPGTQLAVGSAVLEVTEEPHTGCAKFAQRFGHDALRFISTPTGQALRLRGVNTRVVQSGSIRVGDLATRLQPKPR
jgi:MOSC domain-containing protein YiiM